MSLAPQHSAPAAAGHGGATPLVRRLRLRDGRSVSVATLGPAFAASFQSFIRGLSPEARAARFHMGLAEPPSSLVAALVQVDQQRHVAWVAHESGRPDSIVAEVRFAAEGDAAELAVAVADRWRRLGLARALLRRIARRAARAGIRRLWGHVRADNEPMLRLAHRAGFRRSRLPGDAATLLIERELAPAASLLRTTGRRLVAWFTARRRTLSVLAALILPGGFLVLVAMALAARVAPALRALGSRGQTLVHRAAPRACAGCP
ncbi:MAG: GNAT family N-acetyltransferase [Proteobacteria bacterium]|nr:GNAT family N-acetyltransferase [Pseudomonadota bacterium]